MSENVSESDLPDEERGLYPKYHVERIVEKGNGEGTEPVNERVFVLNPTKDPVARIALDVYAKEARAYYPKLAGDIMAWLDEVREAEGGVS